MHPKTLVFLGSKPIGYDCFKNLIGRQDELNVAIAGLLTRHRKEFSGEHDLALLAQQNSIPVFDSLADLPECDLIYSVQYHEILKEEHLRKARQAAVNLHMAPLPEYRGSNQFSFAILEGKSEFGTTIHLMDAGMDSGDILFQKRFPIPANCWVGDLYEMTRIASLQLFTQTLGHVVSGKYTALPQQALEPRYGTSRHYRNEMELIKQIDLNEPEEAIARRIRATSMPGFEPPYCFIDGKKVFFSLKNLL